MLVALALFAMVGMASLAMLEGVIRTRDATEGRLDAVARIDRALLLFGRDVAQSAPGAVALDGDVLSIALPNDRSLSWSRTEDGVLQRSLTAGDADPLTQALVPDVAEILFRVLGPDGDWLSGWPADGAEPLRARGVDLRLTLTSTGADRPSVSRLVELPIGDLP